jgi:hypothetical protein
MNTEQEFKNDLKRDLTHLLNMLDRNTTSLWLDDLSCTTECVVLEDVDLVDESWQKVLRKDGKLAKASGGNIQPYIAFLVSKYDLQSTELKNNPYPVTSSDLQMDRRHFPLPLQRL